MNITKKLTKYDLSEKLQACLKMEMQCADVYHTLVTLFPESWFPEARDLFQTLAEWEERHADIIAIGIEFSKIDEIPDIILPYELSLINLTLDIAQDIKARIGAERVTLKMALSMILKMEESAAESYLQDVMTKRTDSEVISYLQKFYKDEKTHAEMIKELMLKKGFLTKISYN
jgi:rubrerythrin